MRGVPQEPDWHPEGDVLTHTVHALDALVELADWQAASPHDRAIFTFAVLCHDLGKGLTPPSQWPRHHGHEGHSARLAQAYIEGFQGAALGPDSVACMTKHFPGGGPQKDGEDPHFPYGRDQDYPGESSEGGFDGFAPVVFVGEDVDEFGDEREVFHRVQSGGLSHPDPGTVETVRHHAVAAVEGLLLVQQVDLAGREG